MRDVGNGRLHGNVPRSPFRLTEERWPTQVSGTEALFFIRYRTMWNFDSLRDTGHRLAMPNDAAIVTALSVSPNRRLLARTTNTGKIRLWDLQNYQALAECQGHESWVTTLNFAPTEDLLASGGTGGDKELPGIAGGRTANDLRAIACEALARSRWLLEFAQGNRLLKTGSTLGRGPDLTDPA